jgi:cytoskeletal protein CcmA (bactofilin family)
MNDPKRRTTVEQGTELRGELSSTCPIEVNGTLQGNLDAPALQVNPGGVVHGRVKVGEMRSQGELSGEFDADLVVLGGTVRDKTVIRAKSLEVKLNPQNGRMQLTFSECAGDRG